MSASAKQVGNKNWPHAPEALLRGRLVYNVKFYGDQLVQQAKGTEPIKEAVRKMKFNKQLRKAEGQKVTPKVELHINVDGISIQDPKSKMQQYKFPLHHISYCADDKTEKKLFTFIAKDGTTGKHHCFVLGSERNAEEITLTIGQAFDLAYKRFLDKQGSQMEKEKQFMLLQQQVQSLQVENAALKKKVAELESQKQYSEALNRSQSVTSPSSDLTSIKSQPAPAVGTKLEGLLFDDDFNPSPSSVPVYSPPVASDGLDIFAAGPLNNGAHNGSALNGQKIQNAPPEIPVRLAPPPASKTSPRSSQLGTIDTVPTVTSPSTAALNPFGDSSATFGNTTPTSVDAFGMPSFNPNELQRVTAELDDMKMGFNRGLSFGAEDFDLNTLDPLNSH